MKTTIFLIAIVSIFTLFQSVSADTISITMPAGSIIKNSKLDTYVIHRPMGFGITAFYVNGAALGFGDSVIFTPSYFDDYTITASWAGNVSGAIISIEKEVAQNDSIWIASGGVALSAGYRANDTLTNGWIYKTGDVVVVPSESAISLTANSTKPIHHVLWVTNFGSTFSTLSIIAQPTADYCCHIYENVDGRAVYAGAVKLRVEIEK